MMKNSGESHCDQLLRGQSPPRKISQPTQTGRERTWLSSPYQRPHGIVGLDCLDDLEEFKKMIWDYPVATVIPNYNQTPEEVAILCGEGETGRLQASHVEWFLKILNLKQNTSINLCLNSSVPDDVKRLCENMGESVERLNFVLNVGKNVDGSVFVSDHKKCGSHWVFVSLDLSRKPTILYCDSLGWACPENLLECLAKFTSVLGISKLERLIMMHVPSASTPTHQCSADCKNYPVQSCTDVGGLVAVIGAAVSALDKQLFCQLCEPNFKLGKFFLHDPTQYERYLRRVFIHWFLSNNITPSFFKCPIRRILFSHVRPYRIILNPSGKRKVTESPSTQSKVPCNKNVAVTTHSSNFKGGSIVQHQPKDPNSDETNEKVIDLNSSTVSLSTEEGKKRKSQKEETAKNWVCKVCNIRFAFRQGLNKHRMKQHRLSYLSQSKEIKDNCHCKLCTFKTDSILSLIDHYKNIHKKDTNVEQKKFENDEDFTRWKRDIERATTSQYILQRSSKKHVNSIAKHYYCHRSGQQRRILNPTRARVSKKLGSYCTSFITYHKHLDDSTVSVQYCLDHHNHSPSVGYLNLSNEIRSAIIEKLAQGVKSGQILDDIRADLSSKGSECLLTIKDIRKIKKENNFSNVQTHKDRNDRSPVNEQGLDDDDDDDEIETSRSPVNPSEVRESGDAQKLKQLALTKANDIVELLRNTDDKSTIKAIIDGLYNTYTIGCGMDKN